MPRTFQNPFHPLLTARLQSQSNAAAAVLLSQRVFLIAEGEKEQQIEQELTRVTSLPETHQSIGMLCLHGDSSLAGTGSRCVKTSTSRASSVCRIASSIYLVALFAHVHSARFVQELSSCSALLCSLVSLSAWSCPTRGTGSVSPLCIAMALCSLTGGLYNAGHWNRQPGKVMGFLSLRTWRRGT